MTRTLNEAQRDRRLLANLLLFILRDDSCDSWCGADLGPYFGADPRKVEKAFRNLETLGYVECVHEDDEGYASFSLAD